ncbi:unnamed protein product [Tilletia controversa]|nr:unnamed protein product [Tilletia controversa]
METLTRTFSNISDGMPVSVITDVSSWPMLTALLTVVATLAFYQLVLAPPSSLRPKGSRIKPIFSSFPFLGSVGFYSDRVGFLRKHFGDPESSSFHGDARRITVRDATVVLLAGNKDDAKMFYYSRALKFTQAYMKLLSGIPSEITTAAIMNQDKADQMFNENLKQAIRGERLAKLAPLLCEDTVRALDAVPDWKKGKGSMDPKAFTFPVSLRRNVPKILLSIINSTSMSMWILLYLGAHSELRQRASKELCDYLDSMAERQGTAVLFFHPQKSRVEQLQALSLAEWENGFPTIEAALKETIRLNADGTQFRLNAGDATAGTSAPKVQGEEVHKGEFLGYCDPDRWARGEGSGDMEYLGWGTGMHPCTAHPSDYLRLLTGMRFAKLEIKNFATTILALMDWESYNPRSGEVYTIGTLPAPQLNYGHRLPLGPVSLRFTRR